MASSGILLSSMFLRCHSRIKDGKEHRYYSVEDGTHTDGLYAAFPDRLRPLLPCARTAFEHLTAWVEDGVQPPADGLRTRPATGDLVNTCAL